MTINPGEARVRRFTDEEMAENLRDLSDTQLAAIGRLAMSQITDWFYVDDAFADEEFRDCINAKNGALSIRNIQARLYEEEYAEEQRRPTDQATALGI